MSRQLVHLIDDDWEVREALGFLLRTVGLEVRPHADGAAFLEALSGPGAGLHRHRYPHAAPDRAEAAGAARCRALPLAGRRHHRPWRCRGLPRRLPQRRRRFPDQAGRRAGADRTPSRRRLATLDGMLAAESGSASSRERLGRLSQREAEILALIAEGRSTKEIARALSISPRTVDTHRAHLAEKLETTSVAEMVRLHLVGADR